MIPAEIKDVKNSWPLLALLFLMIFLLFRAEHHSLHDFSNYYFSAKYMGSDVDVYDPYAFNLAISREVENVFASYSPHSPLTSLLFYPFLALSAFNAKFLFNLLSILFFLTSLTRLMKTYNIDYRAMLLVGLIFFIPIKNNLLFGQAYLILFSLLVETWMAVEKNKQITAALLLAIAIALKLSPALFLIPLLFTRKWKAFLFSTLSVIVLISISLLVDGIAPWMIFIEEVLPRTLEGFVSVTLSPYFQSADSLFKEFFLFDAAYNPNPLFPSVFALTSFILLFNLIVLCTGLFVSAKNKGLKVLATWSFALVLLSPVGSSYSLILVLPFMLYVLNWDDLPVRIIRIFLLLAMAYIAPGIVIESDMIPDYLRLFIMLALYLGLLPKLKKPEFVISGILILSFVVFAGFKSRKNLLEGKHFIDPNKAVVIGDLSFTDTSITAIGFGPQGKYTQTKNFRKPFTSVEELSLERFHNYLRFKRIHSEYGNVRKVYLVNGFKVYFLCDAKHAYQFSQLRLLK